MRYQVLRAEGYGALESKVQALLKQGWIPVGGVSVCPNSFTFNLWKGEGEVTSFCVNQSMVLKEPGE